MHASSTIVALSSGRLPSGVAVIRLSGPAALLSLELLCGKAPKPRVFALRDLKDEQGQVIDRGLVVHFPAPRSFTGEDCVEFHVHGSKAVVAAILSKVTSSAGVVLAEAGDFTRRAFEAGKLDLTAVEGLGDLIEAETEGQRKLALSRASGGLHKAVSDWRLALLELRAEIEAQLDFSDEGDVPLEVPQRFWGKLTTLKIQLNEALKTVGSGRIVREGYKVVLAGSPNVGKSSLINALTASDVAIVTEEAGTTRDVREVPLDLNGQLVLLYDVAGIRETSSLAEAEGVHRARQTMAQADLVLWLSSPDVIEDVPIPETGAPVLRIGSKSDISTLANVDLALSASTGAGLQSLLREIEARAATETAGMDLLVSHRRDAEALAASLDWLGAIQKGVGELEIVAEHLRGASDALARLTGDIDAEAVLDSLFSGFCIGK